MSLLAAVAIGSAVGGLIMGDKSRKSQKKANEAQAAINRRKNKQSMLRQQREYMMRRAQIIASGALSGAGESSSVRGGAGSLGSQMIGNLEYMQELSDMGGEAVKHQNDASKYQGYASTFQGISSLATTGMSLGAPAPTAAPTVPGTNFSPSQVFNATIG